MRCAIDPGLVLLHALPSGQSITVHDARARTPLSEESFDQAITDLSHALPELTATPGVLRRPARLDLIDSDRFAGHLPDQVRDRVAEAAFYALCDSTNSEVLTLDTPAIDTLNVAIAEFQSAGRGRHGRAWLSGFAEGLCLTVAVRMSCVAPIDPTLTLAIGTQIARSLDDHLTDTVQLKWPNDLILCNGKLGGILVEMSTLPGGGYLMRVGVGVNCTAPVLTGSSGAMPALSPAALSEYPRGAQDRSHLAAGVVAAVTHALDRHREQGFAPFRSAWQKRDYLRGRSVQIVDSDRVRQGTAVGIDRYGALCVETNEGIESLISGEVRVRPR